MRPDIDKAIEALYGDGIRDLTAEGYIEALGDLRKADPAATRRVERLLAPMLKKRLFLRRSRAWHDTSGGTRARMILLPGNPHVQADVDTIREALGIPSGHIQPTENDALWKQVGKRLKPQVVRRVVEGNIVGWWLHLHRKAAGGQTSDEEDKEGLSPELCQSAMASSTVDLSASNVPEWLRKPPCGPPPYRYPAAPVDWAAGRLVERHRLPWHTAGPLTFHLLTQNPDWVTGLGPFSVDVVYEDNAGGDPDSFTVSVRGIDEFMTRADWNTIWERYVRPRQEYLWERRGMKPQGRRTVNIERLQDALQLYRNIVQQGLPLKDVLKGVPEDATVEWDQETIRRAISDLGKLLAPVP